MHAGFVVRGRVQGVGFRWWTAREARRLGLDGTVRNLPCGAVEIHVTGPPGAVHELETALRRGPGTARVDTVERVPSQEEKDSGFRTIG